MRSILVAGFMLSPMLAVASVAATLPSTDAPATTEYHRVTTGVAVPAAIESQTFHLPSGTLAQSSASDAKVVLSLNVDEKGNASNVHVVQSANPSLDASVVSAVLQSHFRPATMNHQPVAVDMNLTFNVR